MNVTQFNTSIVNGYTPNTFSSAVAGQSFILNQSPDKEDLEDTLVLPPNTMVTEVSIKSVVPIQQIETEGRWGIDLNRVFSEDSIASLAYHVPLKWVNRGVALFNKVGSIGSIGTTNRLGGHGILFDQESSTLSVTTTNEDICQGNIQVTLTLIQR